MSRTVCRHCAKGRVSRPRGLCWSCYYAPGVRSLYAASGHSMARRGVGNLTGNRPLPKCPTNALPGTAAKLKVMGERAARGERLWHPADVTIED